MLAARYDLRLKGCRSLKEKRSRLRPVVDRIRHHHRVSIGEVGRFDIVDRAVLEVAVVAPSESRADQVMDRIDRLIWSADLDIVRVERSWLEL